MSLPLASFPSPSVNSFSLGPLDIHVYGILIATGVAIAFSIIRRRYEAAGGDGDLVDRILIWTVIAAFVGARAAYVASQVVFGGEPIGMWVFAIWEGGLAFFGGLTFGAVTAIVLGRRWGADVPALADGVAIGLPLAQAIGRWGNYFNQELFGTPTDVPWAVEIDPANRPAEYAQFATFHPTFLYESLWNLIVVATLLAVGRQGRLRRGSLMGIYGIMYGVGRFLTELIRTDTTFRVLGLSRNAWVALLVVAGSAIWVVRYQRGGTDASGGPDDAGSTVGIDASDGPAGATDTEHTAASTGPDGDDG
jgi:prolipoprotein diacylglyceryl transferase